MRKGAITCTGRKARLCRFRDKRYHSYANILYGRYRADIAAVDHIFEFRAVPFAWSPLVFPCFNGQGLTTLSGFLLPEKQ